MKYCRHIIIAFLLALSCLSSSGEEKVTIRTIQPSVSKTIPYSIGVFIQGGKLSDSYETDTDDLPMKGFEVGGGCYTRLYFHRRQNTMPLCHAQAEIGYRFDRFSDMDNLQDKIAHIDCHYISSAVTLGADMMSIMGVNLGFGCDFLAGFRGAQQSIVYRTINKECMNRFIPKVIVGMNMFDSIFNINLEIPLNSGAINLNRYTYYNRRNISTSLLVRVSARIQIRTFGSSHR